MLPRFARHVVLIVWKDIVSELRTKQLLTSMLAFGILVIIVFSFGFELRIDNSNAIAPGVLWVAFTFTGVLGLNMTFALEKEGGCIYGLMLCPMDRGAIYVGKMLSSVLFIFAVEIIILPVFGVLFNLPLFVPMLLPIMFLGTVGFASVGTLLSAMAVNTKTREVLLPMLLLPVAVPVLISSVKLTGLVLDGLSLGNGQEWVSMLVAFDLVFLVTSFLVFDYLLGQ
jgi:heme exporter protein B